MKAFITGSRAYGRPREDSDIDLVIHCSSGERVLLQMLADPDPPAIVDEPGYNDARGYQMRFGRLNLLVCTTDDQYAVWLLGTRALQDRQQNKPEPVTREEAVAVFQSILAAIGTKNNEEGDR